MWSFVDVFSTSNLVSSIPSITVVPCFKKVEDIFKRMLSVPCIYIYAFDTCFYPQ